MMSSDPGALSEADPQVVLLPGLHGGPELFAQLLEVIPARYRPVVIDYPQHRPTGYDELFEMIVDRTRDIRQMVVLGESFSGPVAVRLAAHAPDRVRLLVLVATFVTCPVPRWFAGLSRLLARVLPTTRFQIRMLLSGWKAPAALIDQVQGAIAAADRDVLARRIAAVSRVDEAQTLGNTRTPLLYLQGRDDRLIRAHNASLIQRLRADAVIEPLPTPHLLLQMAPQQAWDAIQRQLELTAR